MKKKNNIWLVLLIVALSVGGVFLFKHFQTRSNEQALAETDQADFDFYNADMPLEDLKEHGVPMLITFGNEDCYYCEQIKPHLIDLNKKYMGDAIIKYVDTYEYTDMVDYYPIIATPAIMIFDSNGEPYEPSGQFEDIAYQYKNPDTGEMAATFIYGYLNPDQLEDLLGEL